MNNLLHRTSNDRRCSLQIDTLDCLAQVIAAADEVAKVFASYFSLRLNLGCLLLLKLELLHVPLQADTDIVGGAFERATDLGTDAKSVGMRVVDG